MATLNLSHYFSSIVADNKAENVGANAGRLVNMVMRMCGSSFLIVSVLSTGYKILIWD